jgi:hypothetical protein
MVFDYLLSQLRKALATEISASDPDVRAQAERRVDGFFKTLAAIDSGQVRVGSPTPVEKFPAWLTPEVVRGGFATGAAAAAGPLNADEIELAEKMGLPLGRAQLFAWFLSDAGLKQLNQWLDSGLYRVDLPEHGALLCGAWLLRNGRSNDAWELLRALDPWAGQVRFWPYWNTEPEAPGVHAATLPEVSQRLKKKGPHRQVEMQREALSVWAPFSDKVLSLWWTTRSPDGEIGTCFPPGWAQQARDLVAEYGHLAATHTLTTRHASPKENLQILLTALRAQLSDGLDVRTLGRARTAVENMVAKRGEPGSTRLLALRHSQAQTAGQPSHASLAHEAAMRLDETGHTGGIEDPGSLLRGTPAHGLPAVQAVVRQAMQAPLPVLLHEGIVRSAESLATLTPQITADTVASRYSDQAAGLLAKRIYRAFANRRSVLLLNHHSQVTVTAIPWFNMLEQAAGKGRGQTLAHMQALDLATIALQHFPGTVLPNSLVRELDGLFRLASADVPLTFEIASDIFMGSFSQVFVQAAKEAMSLVGGTIYAHYYGIGSREFAMVGTVQGVSQSSRAQTRTAWMFDALVHDRAGIRADGGGYSVAANGRVIEQAQILTTQNLAVLVNAGIRLDWPAQARGAWKATQQHLAKATGSKPLHHRKNAAYAWRQTIFYLSLSMPEQVNAFIRDAGLTRGLSEVSAAATKKLIFGLQEAADGQWPTGGPFLGWV